MYGCTARIKCKVERELVQSSSQMDVTPSRRPGPVQWQHKLNIATNEMLSVSIDCGIIQLQLWDASTNRTLSDLLSTLKRPTRIFVQHSLRKCSRSGSFSSLRWSRQRTCSCSATTEYKDFPALHFQWSFKLALWVYPTLARALCLTH